jgi:hypothetical protein
VLLLVLVRTVVQSPTLLEGHALQILQQSFKNWRKRTDKGELMRPWQELQQKQQWKVVVLGKAREMAQQIDRLLL